MRAILRLLDHGFSKNSGILQLVAKVAFMRLVGWWVRYRYSSSASMLCASVFGFVLVEQLYDFCVLLLLGIIQRFSVKPLMSWLIAGIEFSDLVFTQGITVDAHVVDEAVPCAFAAL